MQNNLLFLALGRLDAATYQVHFHRYCFSYKLISKAMICQSKHEIIHYSPHSGVYSVDIHSINTSIMIFTGDLPIEDTYNSTVQCTIAQTTPFYSAMGISSHVNDWGGAGPTSSKLSIK